MRKMTITLLSLLLILSLALVACGGEEGTPEAPALTATPLIDPTVPPPGGTTVDTITGVAFVEEVDVAVPGPDATEAQVTVRGNLSDACSFVDEVDVTNIEGTTFHVAVTAGRESDAVCAEVLTPFTETFTLDIGGLAAGTYTVEVNDQAQTFTIPQETGNVSTPEPGPAPVLSLSTRSAIPGGTLQLNGGHFPPNSVIQLGVGPQNSEYEVVATATADDSGTFAQTVTLPAYAEEGERWVWVAAWEDNTLVSEPFDVVAAPTPEPPVAALQVSPTSAAPGASLRLTGNGFPANSTVSIGTGPRNSEYEIFTSVPTDAQGNIDATVTLPAFVDAQGRWVLVADWDGNKIISNPVTITTGDVNVPANGQFTRTQVYLIALEDAGQSGEEIGCGDSVIPVEVEIEPTIAPLRAALEQLLAIDEEYYGGSGLYNALHASDLQVGGIDIVNREAIINLSGNLTLGGACDNPRVEAQLTQTALQFSTVDAVTIRVNGTPLEELLSGQ